MTSLYVFMLAAFIGFEVIRRVSPLLHTPLMSLTNALDAIAVVGAIVLAGEDKSRLTTVLATIAVVAATSNIVGGFLHHRPHAEDVQVQQDARSHDRSVRSESSHRDRLSHRDGALHPLA